MKIIGEFGREDIAKLYVASMRDGGNHVVEFVESLQPPIPRDRKWVLIVSSSFGCPMDCLMCDAGGKYYGKLETDEILAQVDHMVLRRFPDGQIPSEKFKIQFARMGEPSFNPNVLDALSAIAGRYHAPGLMACVSTIAPEGSGGFFEKLAGIKRSLYPDGRFQLQFSIHTTDDEKRDWLLPGRKWGLERIARFGDCYHEEGDRKITLNFALTRGLPVDPGVIAAHFDPDKFAVKLTPLNPTAKAMKNGLTSALNPLEPSTGAELAKSFNNLGFETILSIGELEENKIGSNCGQFVSMVDDRGVKVNEGYETAKYRLA
jgi:23S rRNA (adenine2503-C2)-methyltransferase